MKFYSTNNDNCYHTLNLLPYIAIIKGEDSEVFLNVGIFYYGIQFRLK